MALRGLKVVELAGLAPVPFAGMILADFGASVVRVDRPNQPPLDTLGRNKRSIAVSLKQPPGVKVVRELCVGADVLLEPYRPGVMERLGLGPSDLMNQNSKLVYARLTGFGQGGPLSLKAGHDINYLAVSGILSMLGKTDTNPSPPVNLLADFAGGGLMCVMGVLMALFERTTSNRGQVVDAAMVDGSAYLSTFLLTSRNSPGLWTGPRGTNLLDGGSPFYCTYETADGKYMSVGSIEPQFYQNLLKGLDLENEELPSQMDIPQWPKLRQRFADVFSAKSREEWTKVFSDLDACVEPVLEVNEAARHPHNRHRGVYHENPETKLLETNPAPLLGRTPAKSGSGHSLQPEIGQHSVEILTELQYSKEDIRQLLSSGTVMQHQSSGAKL